MNRQSALEAFQNYVNRYDTDDIKIKLKIEHTYRVAEISSRIGASIGADEDFAWLLGLLHDIGRFEQVRRFGTFKDAVSVDHAELGADILFSEGLIDTFPEDVFFIFDAVDKVHGGGRFIAETAVRLHNKLELPDLDAVTARYCKVLRDADKIDIFRVLTEPPYDERNRRVIDSSKGSYDGTSSVTGASDDVMRCVLEHRCVPKAFAQTDFESLISQCCMAFELCFPMSREIVKEQGYLDRLMNLEVANEVMAEQLSILRTERKRAWEEV